MTPQKIPTVAVPETEHKTLTQVPNTTQPVATGGGMNLMGENGLITVAAGVVATIFFLRKKFFQDNNEIKKEKLEVQLLESLRTEMERYKEDARKAWSQRTHDAETIASQKMEIEHLRRTVQVLKNVLEEIAPDKVKLYAAHLGATDTLEKL